MPWSDCYWRLNEQERVEIINPATLLSLVQTCDQETLALVLQDPSTLIMLERYVIFEDKVHAGFLGKTATFWLSVIDHTRLIIMLQYAVKSNGDMANLFIAYDGRSKDASHRYFHDTPAPCPLHRTNHLRRYRDWKALQNKL